MASQREASKKEWTSRDTLEEVNAGSLQRIADATEKMASNYTQLQNNLDWEKKANKGLLETCERLRRRNQALRGVITKLKKKL